MARAQGGSRWLLLASILVLLGSVACGDDPPDPQPDSGTQVADSGTRPGDDAGTVDSGTGGMDGGTGGTDGGSWETDAGTGHLDGGTGDTDAGTGPADGGTVDTDAGTGNSDAGPGNTDGGTGHVDGGTGTSDGGTGNTDAGTGNTDAGTGNTDAGTGNTDGGTGNADSGTGDAGPGNWDAGPGNTDGGTGNADSGTGDAGPGNWDAGPGNTDGGTGNADSGTGDAGPGNWDAGPGNTDGGTGNADSGTGDAGPGNWDAGPGNWDAGPGNTDAGPGNTDAGPGNWDAGPGNWDAGPGDWDAGPGNWDAGTGDAGTDGGTGDAGTDGGVACIPSGYDAGTGDPEVVADPTVDILVRLRAIPGLTVQENPDGMRLPTGYRYFVMTYNQPADHAHPECQRFEQGLTLLHTADTKPMVLFTTGYYNYPAPARSEPTQLLGANQLSVEHRFFPPSIPEPADWSQLTIKQSADDFHRIVQALKPIYTGKWVSTGGSKGGETVVFFRRFYPDDVDATVAYVAPIARRDDERFPAFQAIVGGDAQAACRERLWAFQNEVLNRRDRMVDLVRAYAEEQGLPYTRLGYELALEHATIETYFAFWQYDYPQFCELNIPDPSATDEELLATLDYEVGLSSFSDPGMGAYAAYYYQSALELGWPQPYEAHLGSLIHYPGTDTGDVYSPPGIPFVFRPQAMPDVQDWVSNHGQRLMFVYGGLDPWSAAAYSLGDAQDSYFYVVPEGNHGSRITQLPSGQQAEARANLNRWMGLSPLMSSPKVRLEEEAPEFGPRVPPRLRPGMPR